MAAQDVDTLSTDRSDGAESFIELMTNPNADHSSLYPVGKRYYDLTLALMVSAQPDGSESVEDFEVRQSLSMTDLKS